MKGVHSKSKPGFVITLFEGNDFGNIETFFPSFFSSFSLISWVTRHHQIKVIEEHVDTISESFVNEKGDFIQGKTLGTIQFTHDGKNEHKFIGQIDKFYIKQGVEGLIKYDAFTTIQKIRKKRQNSSEGNVEVRILKNVETKNIFVEIYDDQKLFIKHFGTQLREKKEFQKKDWKDDEIEYYYTEPAALRNKTFDKCHLSLAFQGGGVKGVSYVGVYKALKAKFKDEDVRIRSVIGSSAGGILALAISAGIPEKQLYELCFQLKTMTKDQKFVKPPREEVIKRRIATQLSYVRPLLHKYGIIQDKIFDVVKDALIHPNVEHKVLKVLEKINPSIFELLSYDLDQNEYYECTNCNVCCKQKKTIVKKGLNYFGLFDVALMTGNAVEDIAVQCMTMFLQKNLRAASINDVSYCSLDFQKAKLDQEIIQRARRKKMLLPILKRLNISETELNGELTPQLKNKIKKITLKDYYEITDIQFTCTSVDLKDQILRFFNHKTTPHLPICKAVQMTGSFPVAFEAQTWKKEWGKYYIHYQNTRREIDLTGHQFTDGGLLANFPIKYLDNQSMRPMYFSHKKTEKTIIYGFGLEQLEDQPMSEKDKKEFQALTNDLMDEISAQIPKCKALCALISFPKTVSKQQRQLDLDIVHVVDFILKLIKTLAFSDRNLNIQAFDKSLIKVKVQPKIFKQNYSKKQLINNYNQFKKVLDVMWSNLEKRHEEAAKARCSLKVYRARLTNKKMTSQEDIHLIRKEIQQKILIFTSYKSLMNRQKNNNCLGEQKLIEKLADIDKQMIFRKANLEQSKEDLLQVIKDIQAHYLNQDDNRTLIQLEDIILNRERQKVENLKKLCDDSIKGLKYVDQEVLSKKKYGHKQYEFYKAISTILNPAYPNKLFLIYDYDDEINLQQLAKNQSGKIISEDFIRIQKQIFQKTEEYKQKISKLIEAQWETTGDIHVLLEANQNSSLYFANCMEILQSVIKDKNQERPSHCHEVKIAAITTTDYHSIFSFLYAGGLTMEQIRKQMWIVKDLFQFEPTIKKQFDSYKWVKIEAEKMRQAQEFVWDERYELFSELEQQSEENFCHEESSKLLLNRAIAESQYSKQLVIQSMEDVMSYVISSFRKMQTEPEQRRREKLGQLLALNLKNGRQFKKQVKQISINTQNIIKEVLFYFEELMIHLVLQNDIIQNYFEVVEEQYRDIYLKGIIIKKLITAKRLKIYILQKLQEMDIRPPNISMKDFYKMSKRKFYMNFTEINSKLQRMMFMNKWSKPNMPVWVAILGATTLPYIHREVRSRAEWETDILDNIYKMKLRKAKQHFQNVEIVGDISQYTYISGNYINSLPLELLSNKKIAQIDMLDYEFNQVTKTIIDTSLKKIASQKKEKANPLASTQNTDAFFIFVNFCFERDGNSSLAKQIQIDNQKVIAYRPQNRRFPNFCSVLGLLCRGLCGYFEGAAQGVSYLFQNSQFVKNNALRVNAHDNFVLSIYYDQLIKLPLRVGTLDFYKIQKDDPEIMNDTVTQAEYIVKQALDHLELDHNNKEFPYFFKNFTETTFLQIHKKVDHMRVKFISISKWTCKTTAQYQIYYKPYQNNNLTYKKLYDDYIDLKKDQYQFVLKFTFVNQDINLESKQYLFNLKDVSQGKQKSIFQINYRRVGKFTYQSLKNDEVKFEKSNPTTSIDKIYILQKPDISNNSAKELKSDEMHFEDRNPEESKSQKSTLYVTSILDCHDQEHCVKCLVKLQQIDPRGSYLASCTKCDGPSVLLALECPKCKTRFCYKCNPKLIPNKAKYFSDFKADHNGQKIVICTICARSFLLYDPKNQSTISCCMQCQIAAAAALKK